MPSTAVPRLIFFRHLIDAKVDSGIHDEDARGVQDVPAGSGVGTAAQEIKESV